jgi:mRNA interferase RelE/StbE
MVWQINFTPGAQKDLAGLDNADARRIERFLKERISVAPKATGSLLKGQLREFWRWRVGDYRILAKIEENILLILVVQIGHRSKIYRGH